MQPSLKSRLVKTAPKKGLTSVAMLHTSNRFLKTCSIYVVLDFRVISILLFSPPAREDLRHGDQQRGDGGLGLGLIIKSKLNLSSLIIIFSSTLFTG